MEFPSIAALALSIPSLGNIIVGYSFGATNTALVPLSVSFGWCDSQQEFWMAYFDQCPAYTGCQRHSFYIAAVAGVGQIGGLIGSCLAPDFAAKGRRLWLMLTHGLSILGLIFSSFSFGFWSITISRLILGLAMGALGFLGPLYLNETAPPKDRGFYSGFCELFFVMGTFLAQLMGIFFDEYPLEPEDPDAICGGDDSRYSNCGDSETDGEYFCDYEQSNFDAIWWRVLVGIFCIPFGVAAIILLIVVFKFETPYCLLVNGDEESSKSSLMTLRDAKEFPEVEDEFIKTADLVKEYEAEIKQSQGFLEFHKEPRETYTIWVSIIIGLLSNMSGIVPMGFMPTVLFVEAGMSQKNASYVGVAVLGIQFVFTIILMVLIDKTGRRPLMITGATIQFLATVTPTIALLIDPESVVSLRIAAIGAVVFIVGFCIGAGGLTIVYLFEMFPPHMRHSGQKFAMGATWVAMIVDFFTVPLMTSTQTFMKSAVLSFVALLVYIFLVEETKGLPVGSSPYFPEEKVERREEREDESVSTEEGFGSEGE